LRSLFHRLGGALAPACLLVQMGCGGEPILVLDVPDLPAGSKQIAVEPYIDQNSTNSIYFDPTDAQYAVHLPPGISGTLKMNFFLLDTVGCTLATGTLTQSLPLGIRNFAEVVIPFAFNPVPTCPLQVAETTGNRLLGTVTADPPGISCDFAAPLSSSCTDVYPMGTFVSLKASGLDSSNIKWAGDCTVDPADPTICGLTVTRKSDVTLVFE
jgi:hypothetical protein